MYGKFVASLLILFVCHHVHAAGPLPTDPPCPDLKTKPLTLFSHPYPFITRGNFGVVVNRFYYVNRIGVPSMYVQKFGDRVLQSPENLLRILSEEGFPMAETWGWSREDFDTAVADLRRQLDEMANKEISIDELW